MWTEMSNPAVLVKIGSRIREARIRRRMTQEELARQSGVSTLTVSNVEKGRSVTMSMFISILRSLVLLENLENLVPEIKVSPIELKKLLGKKVHRVRRIKFGNND